MRLRRSRKIWRVHEGHDFEASSQFQAAEREQTEPTKPHRFAEPVFYRLCSGRDHHDQIPAGHPDIEKVRDPQSASARPMSRARLIAGISTRGSSRWEGDRISQVRAELARLFDERIKFFSKTYSTAAEGHRNCANNKKDRSAYGSDLGNYADCEKWQRQKLDGVRR